MTSSDPHHRHAPIFRLLIVLLMIMCAANTEAKVFLVSVGVADYPGEDMDLKVCSRDARTITYIFYRNLRKDLYYKQLLDSTATNLNILAAMKDLFSKAAEDDQVILFFSGHGYGGGFYSYDGYLSYTEVKEAMATAKCKNKMVFADACYSGKIRTDEKKDSLEETTIRESNVMLFLSSRNSEVSFESIDMKNGYFTTFLSKGLQGAADADSDRTITAKELYEYVHNGVTKFSLDKQHPVMWGNFADNMVVMKW